MEYLAIGIRQVAEYRAEVADGDPDDAPRQLACVAALRSFASFVESLDATDVRLGALGSRRLPEQVSVPLLGLEPTRYLMAIGIDIPPPPVSAAFGHLIEACLRETGYEPAGSLVGDVAVIEDEGLHPFLRLEALGHLRRCLDDLERDIVDAGRQSGMSWQLIGAALGRTKQAMAQRFG